MNTNAHDRNGKRSMHDCREKACLLAGDDCLDAGSNGQGAILALQLADKVLDGVLVLLHRLQVGHHVGQTPHLPRLHRHPTALAVQPHGHACPHTCMHQCAMRSSCSSLLHHVHAHSLPPSNSDAATIDGM